MRLVGVAACTDAQLVQGAALVYASLPAYYDLFAVDALAVIARSFRVAGTSVEHTTFAIADDDTVAGIYAAHDLAQLRRAGYVDLQQLMRPVPTSSAAQVKDAIRAHAQQVAPLDGDGRYLARFAVAAAHRGTGLAGTLLDHFEQGAARCALHVHVENARAIAFYRRRGYTLTGPETPYRVMTKP